jgi:hypothetical protein
MRHDLFQAKNLDAAPISDGGSKRMDLDGSTKRTVSLGNLYQEMKIYISIERLNFLASIF